MPSDLTLTEVASAPPTPSANKVVFYVKSDGRYYYKDDAGTEIALTGAGGSNTLLDGSAHTDTLLGVVLDGDVIIGNVTPKWSRLAIAIPAANVRNVLGIDNAELRPSWKTALDATNPANVAAAAAPGTSLVFAHRDHAHLLAAAFVTSAMLADMAQATVKGRAAAAGTGVPVDLTAAQLITILTAADGAGSLLDADLLDGLSSAVFTAVSLTFIIDGGGSAITTGQKGHLEIPFACTLTGWTILADQSGSIVVDVWKDTYANFPPTVADTIAGSEKPTLASVQKNQDLALGTWTTAVAAGDILAFNVDSITTVTRVLISLRATKT